MSEKHDPTVSHSSHPPSPTHEKVEQKTQGLHPTPKAVAPRDWTQVALNFFNNQMLLDALTAALHRVLADMEPEALAAELERRGVSTAHLKG
jgi:hypothetical protein